MTKFINISGMRVNPDHIHCYHPAGGDNDKRTYINIGGKTDPYPISVKELDELLEESDALSKNLSSLTSAINRLWELLRARLH